jgi:hypothetical protein
MPFNFINAWTTNSLALTGPNALKSLQLTNTKWICWKCCQALVRQSCAKSPHSEVTRPACSGATNTLLSL